MSHARYSPQSPVSHKSGSYPQRHHEAGLLSRSYPGSATTSAPSGMPMPMSASVPVQAPPHHSAHLSYYHSATGVSFPPPPHSHHHQSQPLHHPHNSGYSHPAAQQHPYMHPVAVSSATGDANGIMRSPLISAEERERKRRISHSAMERRRRERTNNIIDELKALIPWLRDEARLQKLEVLEQCVCYIKELQASGAAPSSPKRRRLVQTVHDEDEEEEHVSSDYKDNARRSNSSVCADERPLAQYRSGSPVHVDHVPNSAKSATAFSCDDAECWDAVSVAGHSHLTSSDLPDLVNDSGVTSKASSTVSTITPFRLCSNDAAIKGPIEGRQPSSPGVKNSIDFLTS